MKKRFLSLICLLATLSIFLCGCYSKYDNLINAIENGTYAEAESELFSLTSEILAEKYVSSSNGDESTIDSDKMSSTESVIESEIKVIAITSENFFDYFYIEKKKVPYVTDTGKTINLNLPAYISLKKDYTLASLHTETITQIAIEFTAEYTMRYCVANEDFSEVIEVGEPYDFQHEEPEHKTMTINSARTSVYEKGMAGFTTGDRHVNHVFDNFEILRAIGTLCIVDNSKNQK